MKEERKGREREIEKRRSRKEGEKKGRRRREGGDKEERRMRERREKGESRRKEQGERRREEVAKTFVLRMLLKAGGGYPGTHILELIPCLGK